MTPPSMDAMYDYRTNNGRGGGHGKSGNGASESQQQQRPLPGTPSSPSSPPRVRKGLGARSMMQQQDDNDDNENENGHHYDDYFGGEFFEEQYDSRPDPRSSSGAVVSPAPRDVNNEDDDNDGRQPQEGDEYEDEDQAGVDNDDEDEDDDDALLDLDQLEELQHEAERMKALGNKHMAAQEYTRAYNAYSAALQLSPVGPSSHVFLSNRSAALLSLKRYSAAATDARRAIALAPTFGKAHARLGQSLYFLKDYEAAVGAYEDAIHYEPENPITKTYLEKARSKWQRQQEKMQRQQQQQQTPPSSSNGGSGHTRGEEQTVVTTESSVQQTVVNSVVTDPHGTNAVVQSAGYRSQSRAMVNAVGGALGAESSKNAVSPPATINEATLDEHLAENKDGQDDDVQDDPDFDEALRIQERANRYLANKNYKYAIEEYTAALFLVPDDENLSPELHLGRAHALNGSRRHESAKIDSQLAIKIKPTPEAYSTLAKSLFYMKDYEASVEAFGKCRDALPEGESLSMFDRAYLQKAEAALQDYLENGRIPDPATSKRKISSAPVPKLKPPKFVSREEALNRTPNMPAMPNHWPQQSPRDKSIKFEEERDVTFLSEALGIKLNRGPDGIVRVIEVSPDVPGSPIAREGTIEVGDVIREAAGVDIRRPLTNIMWGDTVALLKMAPRPIVLVVAKEVPVGPSIVDQRKQAAQNALSPTSASHAFPSNSSTEESVRDQMQRQQQQESTSPSDLNQTTQDETNDDIVDDTDGSQLNDVETNVEGKIEQFKKKGAIESNSPEVSGLAPERGASLLDKEESEKTKEEVENRAPAKSTESDTPSTSTESPAEIVTPVVDYRDEEARIVGAEIMFERKDGPKYNGWDNLRWMSYSGERKIVACDPVFKYTDGQRRSWFGVGGDDYVPRRVAVYEYPPLILILRELDSIAEFRELMELPPGADVEDEGAALKSHLFVESVIDPKLSKLRLSQLTTVTSIITDGPNDSARRRSCFSLISPFEEIALSAVRPRKGSDDTCFADSGAFLETSGVEHSLSKAICRAHNPSASDEDPPFDLSWKHQVILGTLHSFVVTGSKFLDEAIKEALLHDRGRDTANPACLNRRVVDAIDESGKTALHYACESRFSQAVASLVKVGASVDVRAEPQDMTPCHICAKNLDFKSLSCILSANRRPNVLDSLGRTPMFLAIANGRTVGGKLDPEALDQCLTVMEKYGGEVGCLTGYPHPVCLLASRWQSKELAVLLWHCNFRYPVLSANKEEEGISISALYQYPIHAALISLRSRIHQASEGGNVAVQQLWEDCAEADDKCVKTLKILVSCGFEANERIEAVSGDFPEKEELVQHVGFAPIQIIAAVALETFRHEDLFGEALCTGIIELLVNLSEILIRNGARLTLDAPSLTRTAERSKSNLSGSGSSDDLTTKAASFDRAALKIQSNKELTKFFDTPEKIAAAQSYWKSLKPAAVPAGKFVFHTDKLPIEDSSAPGGSDEKTCATCWVSFGMLVRKHRCRISRRYLCDACSSHRVLDGDEHRVSDGQFVLAKSEEIKEMDRKLNAAVTMERQAQQRKQQQQLQQVHNGTAAARRHRLEEVEASNRDSLFGGIVAGVTKTLGGAEAAAGEEAVSASTDDNADSIAGLNSQLNQTRDALNERGEKLSTLADKSDKLVNASQDFAAMAKELNRKSSQGFFW